MPPYVPRKRERSSSPAASPSAKRQAKKPAASRSKPTVFDAADAPKKHTKTVEEGRKLLASLNNDDDDESSLSEADSDEFEDVFPVKRRKTSPSRNDNNDDDDDDEEEEMDWEDAMQPVSPTNPTPGPSTDVADEDIGDLSISIDDNSNNTPVEYTVSAGVNKKGPSKRERQVRIQSHCLHVQSLLWHNTVRNSWLNDKEVQETLVSGLSEGVKREVTRWREAMGMLTEEELDAKKRKLAAKHKNRRGGYKGKGRDNGRDWSYSAEHLEQGVPNLSGGDPLLRLLKVLAAYWRKRFTVTAPGLRKQGYKSLTRLRDEVKGWKTNMTDVEEYGERIETREDFRKVAKATEGSRDVGAQLFIALLRGLKLDTRMVANLQPVGFGWGKGEEADPKRPKKKDDKESNSTTDKKSSAKPTRGKKSEDLSVEQTPTKRAAAGNAFEPIDLDDSDSSLSSVPSEKDVIQIDDDDTDMSVIEITPTKPKKRETKKFDRDLAFPNYWIEVCSPVSNKFIPVDPMVLSTIASNDELVQTFEPRGKKAEKAKQVICYTIAYSSDGSAKDVTVRYLKKHQLPGKTKGSRFPIERIPVYNPKGKVKKYEEYDWFRTVMSLYDRPHNKRTAADDLEEQTDLKPFKPAKEAKEVEKESLQWYKQSADYVLEAHLRREEALIPGAKSIKTFTAGKGDKAVDHPVYRRSDVVSCKTVESWHKEGRELKPGQQPMKLVPTRAVTLVRKREIEEALRETGEKLKQGLYSRDQTDWIVPPPIENGIIPKNAFGNIDVYVPTMVPSGAVHLPLKGSAKICRKLNINFAEACTGFEFGKQRAVPVLTGVVVAEEHKNLVRDAWRADRIEQQRKEDTKRRELSLRTWRKMLLGLRVIQRMKDEYQDSGAQGEEEYNPFVVRAKRDGRTGASGAEPAEDDDNAGGFFRPGYDEEEVANRPTGNKNDEEDEFTGGGFLVDDDDADVKLANDVPEPEDGGFLVEEDADTDKSNATSNGNQKLPTPLSLQALHKNESPKEGDVGDSLSSALSEEADESEDEAPRKPQSSNKRGAKSRPKAVKKKATPLKSKYFEDEEDDEDDEDEASDSEQEVVKPRKTTARTKAKR